MNDKNRKKLIAKINKLKREATKETSLARLVGAGILHKDGSVNCKNYPHLGKYMREQDAKRNNK